MDISRKKRTRLIAGASVALVVVAAIVASVLLLIQPPRSAPAYDKEIGTPVRADGAKVRVDGPDVLTELHAQVAADVPPAFAGLDPDTYEKLSPVIAIDPSGDLPAPMTVRVPLGHAAAEGGLLVVMTRSADEADWRFVDNARLSQDRLWAEFELDHLSFIDAYNFHMNKFLNPLSDTLAEALGGGVLTPDDPPACKGTEQARADGYAATLKSNLPSAVAWCDGIEGGVHVVKVVSYRRYPVEVKLTGAEPLPDGMLQLRADEVVKATGRVIIMPGETAVFHVKDLDAGGTARIEIIRSSMTHYLDGLDSLAGSLLQAFGGKSKPDAMLAARKLSWTKECYNALAAEDPNPVSIDDACFEQTVFEKLFGKKIAGLAKRIGNRLLLMGAFQGYLQAYTDELSKSDTHVITVKRSNPMERFAGQWTQMNGQQEHAMNIMMDGTGEIGVNGPLQNGGFDYTPQPSCVLFSARITVEPLSDGRSADVTYSDVRYPCGTIDDGPPVTDGTKARFTVNESGQLFVALPGRNGGNAEYRMSGYPGLGQYCSLTHPGSYQAGGCTAG